MPTAQVGDIVLWHPSGCADAEATPAVVTHVGECTLAMSLLPKDSYALGLRDGVRHIDDPILNQTDAKENGGWQHTPQTKELHNRFDDILLMLKKAKTT